METKCAENAENAEISNASNFDTDCGNKNNNILHNLLRGNTMETYYAENAELLDNNKTNFFCEMCEIACKNEKLFQMHLKTKKHLKQISKPDFRCHCCDLTFRDKHDLERHFLSAKHKKMLKKNEEKEKENEKDDDVKCENCNTKFNSRSGLWKHRKKCMNCEELEASDKEMSQPLKNVITPELIMLLIQQNKEMQHAMLEMAKNMGNNNNNTNNIQNNIQNNKSFNLNVFLNETCKDAMNMSDFLNRLDVTTYDFEETGKNGYVHGMCRILENGLNQLEVHERPIHCTDAKRETIYIKDNDKWEKDDEQKTKLTSVIKQVGAKNIKMIPQWCKEHPGWNDGDSKENDRYLKYVFNSMCGGTDEEIYKNYGDIARYISKITVVDKKEAIEL